MGGIKDDCKLPATTTAKTTNLALENPLHVRGASTARHPLQCNACQEKRNISYLMLDAQRQRCSPVELTIITYPDVELDDVGARRLCLTESRGGGRSSSGTGVASSFSAASSSSKEPAAASTTEEGREGDGGEASGSKGDYEGPVRRDGKGYPRTCRGLHCDCVSLSRARSSASAVLRREQAAALLSYQPLA